MRTRHSSPILQLFLSSVVVAGLVLQSGCTAKYYRKSADREAARIIAQKSPAVPNMEKDFSIEARPPSPLDGFPVVSEVEEFLGADADAERGAHVLNLEDSLGIAVNQSREYQTQREVLYLAALGLSIVRWNFTPIFTSSGNNITVQNQPRDVAKAVDELAGTQTSLLQRDTEVVQQYNISGRGGIGMQMLLRSGARLANSFSIDFLKFLNGDARMFVRSSLSSTITQPLLRGAGYRVTMENLTQGERNMLYSVRDYTQFRREFSVRVAQQYYGVLQARDSAKNNWRGYQNFKRSVDRGRAFAEEGRTAQAELGRLEQASLNAEADWINAVRNYKQSLDQFKILLGLPTDAKLVLDDRELDEMKIIHPDLAPEDAVKVALTTRLDLLTARDRAEDAARRVPVVASSLKPGLDLVISGNIDSKPGQNNPGNLDLERARGTAGVNLDLPLNRKGQRNNYRSAIIDKERAGRELQLREDQVKLQIYDGWRNLDQAKRNFEISELGVELSLRRVEEQELRAELGRGTAQDLVDAQTDLVASRNRRTAALVNHTIARLQFWRDMGILFIKDNGQWEEIADAKSN